MLCVLTYLLGGKTFQFQSQPHSSNFTCHLNFSKFPLKTEEYIVLDSLNNFNVSFKWLKTSKQTDPHTQQDSNFLIFHYIPFLPYFQIMELHNLIFPFWNGMLEGCCPPHHI